MLEKPCCTCVFCFQTELDIGVDCLVSNSADCKTGLVCDATGSTCSECFVVVVAVVVVCVCARARARSCVCVHARVCVLLSSKSES